MTGYRRSMVSALGARIAGAAIWVGLVLLRLFREDRSWWLARDDGVITLSHARNLVEFGTIGVSPVGDRVEGTSSPLHLAVAAAFSVGRTWDPGPLTIVIIVVGVAMAGWCVADLFHTRWRVSVERPVAAVLAATALSGLLVAASWSATGWIGSGMENPLVVATAFVIVAATAHAGTRTAQVLGALGLACFALSRIEFAAFAVPVGLAMVWAEVEAAGPRPKRGLRAGAVMVLAAAGAVALVHLGRRWYFGAWLPNTAVAQDRVQGLAQFEVILWLTILASIPSTAATLRLLGYLDRLPDRTRRTLGWSVRTAVVMIGARLLWLAGDGRLPGDVMRLPTLMPVLVLVTILVLVAWTSARSPVDRPTDWVLAGVALVPLMQYVVMGPARMEEFRVASLAVPALSVLVVALVGDVVLETQTTDDRQAIQVSMARRLAAAAAALALALGLVAWRDGPRYLQWEIAHADALLDEVDRFSAEHLGDDVIPILANPDLGKVSYAKTAVIVDLGILGDPVLAALDERSPDQIDTYLASVALPDLVELHGSFTCRFEPWVSAGPYRAANDPADHADHDASCAGDDPPTIWRRTDAAAELALANRLATAADPSGDVASEVARCATLEGDVWRCEYVRRAVVRAAKPLRAARIYDEVIAAMSASPTWDLDEPLLRRGPGWGGEAAAAFLRLAS